MPPRPFHCTALPIEGVEAAAAAAAPGQLRDLQFQLGRSVAHVAALLLVLVLVWSGLVLPLMRAAIALETHKPHAPRTHTHSCTHTHPKLIHMLIPLWCSARRALVTAAATPAARSGQLRVEPTTNIQLKLLDVAIGAGGRGKGSGLCASGTM